MNARATPEALVPLEQMLIGRDTTAQGRELLAALTGADLPGWVDDVLRIWRMHDPRDAARQIQRRVVTAGRLINIETHKRHGGLRCWTTQQHNIYDVLRADGSQHIRLLTTQEADLIAAPVPTVAPYLRSCVRGGWQPGLLACTLLDLLALNPAQEEG